MLVVSNDLMRFLKCSLAAAVTLRVSDDIYNACSERLVLNQHLLFPTYCESRGLSLLCLTVICEMPLKSSRTRGRASESIGACSDASSLTHWCDDQSSSCYDMQSPTLEGQGQSNDLGHQQLLTTTSLHWFVYLILSKRRRMTEIGHDYLTL